MVTVRTALRTCCAEREKDYRSQYKDLPHCRRQFYWANPVAVSTCKV